MALSPAEKMRALRKRKRAGREKSRRSSEADRLAHALRKPFSSWVADRGQSLNWNIPLDNAGINPLHFEDDSGPRSLTGLLEQAAEDLCEPLPGNSLGRAEIIVASLIDAASELAVEINAYKRAEITARIAEIQAADLSDPNAKKQAFADMARLTKMLDQLDKQVRWTFPQWKATGE